MNASRKASIVAGGLMLLGTGAGILSMAPAVDDASYLLEAARHEQAVLVAALFQFVMAFAYVALAVTLYPVLRRHDQWLALGFAAFRVIAGVFLVLGLLSLPLLVTLSQAFVKAGSPESSHFQTFGELLRTGRDLINHVAAIVAVSIGGIMYYALLFRTRLVPRWLSGWGLAGAALSLSASFLVMFRMLDIISVPYFALNSPMALQEMVLATWLLAKGFDTTGQQATPLTTCR